MKKFRDFMAEAAEHADEADHKKLTDAGWKKSEHGSYTHPDYDELPGHKKPVISKAGKSWKAHAAHGQSGDHWKRGKVDSVIAHAHKVGDEHKHPFRASGEQGWHGTTGSGSKKKRK